MTRVLLFYVLVRELEVVLILRRDDPASASRGRGAFIKDRRCMDVITKWINALVFDRHFVAPNNVLV